MGVDLYKKEVVSGMFIAMTISDMPPKGGQRGGIDGGRSSSGGA